MVDNQITPVTLSAMREQLNGGKQINSRTLFDQLDAIDLQRAVASVAESALRRKRAAEDDALAGQPEQQLSLFYFSPRK